MSGAAMRAGVAALVAAVVYSWLSGAARSPETIPYSKSNLAQLPQFCGQHAEDLFWSTYRPGQYFGMRTRSPKSLLAGLMWFDPQRPDALSNIRHNAQERDGLSKYGWEAHDGKTYGRQELHDTPFHLTTSWVKRQCTSCGYGGDWALLLDVKKAPTPIPTPDASAEHDPSDQDVKLPRISVFFYVADEAGRSAEIQTDGLKGRSGLQGGSRVVQGGGVAGGWQLHMGSSSGLGKLRHLGVQTPHMHNLTELVQQSLVLKRSKGQSRGTPAYQLPNTAAAASNVAIFQLTATLPFTLEVAFLGGPSNGQKTIREPVTACSDCASKDGTQPESISDRAKALQGRISNRVVTQC
ncbi:hypothetical protein ABBQ38_015160 [Trebouxia sp. C0009 RCD-2024]